MDETSGAGQCRSTSYEAASWTAVVPLGPRMSETFACKIRLLAYENIFNTLFNMLVSLLVHVSVKEKPQVALTVLSVEYGRRSRVPS
jgi:hypothetical protein